MTDPTSNNPYLSGPQPLPGPGSEPPEGGDFWRSRAWRRRLGETSIAGYASTLLAFVGSIIAARALGAEEFGAVILAVSVATVVAIFLDVTLEEAVVHHGTRALVDDDLGGLRALLRRSMTLDVVVGIVVCALIVAFAAPLADLASDGRLDDSLVRLAGLSALAVTANSTTSAVLLVARRPEVRAWCTAATNLLRVAGVAVAVALGGAGEAVIVSFVVSSALGGVLQARVAWAVAWRGWVQAAQRGESPVSSARLLRFGLHTSVTTSITAIQGAVIPILLGRLSGTAAVGVFRVAMLPVFAADTLSGPLRLVLFPEQARMAAEGNIGQLRRAMAAYTLVGLVLGLAAATAGWFLLPWLIPAVYSSEFDDAVEPARILLGAAVIHFAIAWGKSLPAAIGRPEVRTAATALLLVLTIALLAIFGDQGSTGAAIAFTSATAVASATWLVIAFRLLASEERNPRRSPVGAGSGGGPLL